MKKIIFILILLNINLYGTDVVLKLPVMPFPSIYDYVYELLAMSFDNNNVTYKITQEITTLPKSYNLLEEGKLSAIIAFEREEMNKKYIQIPFNLTNNLVGKRVLFIPKGDQYIYDNVQTLDDFRDLKKIGAFGEDWYDIKIWEKNNLLYYEKIGNSNNIYLMLINKRGFDYFSRGVNEIVSESKNYPELDIEKRLMLQYDYDFNLYMSKKGPFNGSKYEKIIIESLKKALEDGIIEQLREKYWGKDLAQLNINDRVIIKLVKPD